MNNFIYDINKFMFLNMKCDEHNDYEFEKTIKEENDRIQIMDSLIDGRVSYYLELLKKWNNDVDSMPTTANGLKNKKSIASWYKNNDKLSLVAVEIGKTGLGCDYSSATIDFFGKTFYAPLFRAINFSTNKYKNKSLVDELFHCMCEYLMNKETSYFNGLSIFEKKCCQIKNLYQQTKKDFNSIIVQDILSNNDIERFKIEELDKIIFCYKQFESIQKMEKELNSRKTQLFSFSSSDSNVFNENSINHEYTNEVYEKGLSNGKELGFNQGVSEQKNKMIKKIDSFRHGLIYGHPADGTLYDLLPTRA